MRVDSSRQYIAAGGVLWMRIGGDKRFRELAAPTGEKFGNGILHAWRKRAGALPPYSAISKSVLYVPGLTGSAGDLFL